jgi:hypothetical protein
MNAQLELDLFLDGRHVRQTLVLVQEDGAWLAETTSA